MQSCFKIFEEKYIHGTVAGTKKDRVMNSFWEGRGKNRYEENLHRSNVWYELQKKVGVMTWKHFVLTFWTFWRIALNQFIKPIVFQRPPIRIKVRKKAKCCLLTFLYWSQIISWLVCAVIFNENKYNFHIYFTGICSVILEATFYFLVYETFILCSYAVPRSENNKIL